MLVLTSAATKGKMGRTAEETSSSRAMVADIELRTQDKS